MNLLPKPWSGVKETTHYLTATHSTVIMLWMFGGHHIDSPPTIHNIYLLQEQSYAKAATKSSQAQPHS